MNTNKTIYGKKDEFYKMYDKEMKIIQKNLYNKLKEEEEYENIINIIDNEKKDKNLEGCYINRLYFKHETEIIRQLNKR
jgi:hypothetical protein